MFCAIYRNFLAWVFSPFIIYIYYGYILTIKFFDFTHFPCFSFCLLCRNRSQFGKCSITHSNRNLKTIYCTGDFHANSFNAKISLCLNVNLRTMQSILIQLDESTADYEGTAARKLYSGRSDKSNPEIVNEIVVMVYNDPCYVIPPHGQT